MKFVSAAVAALVLAATPAVAADWRTPDPENVMVIDTNKGRIIVELEPGVAPAHVERLRTLTRRGFYDGLTFFRVIDGFMAQTGDPENSGAGQSDLPDLKAEYPFRRGPTPAFTVIDKVPPTPMVPAVTEVGFIGSAPVRSAPSMQMMMAADGKVWSWGLFCQGVVGIARSQDPDSGNSQFFLMRDYVESLDANYTAAGRVVSGLDVVRAIKAGEPVAAPQDRMTRVRLLADIPAAERTKVEVMDPSGEAFRALVAAAKAKAGGSPLSPCDIDIPAKVG